MSTTKSALRSSASLRRTSTDRRGNIAWSNTLEETRLFDNNKENAISTVAAAFPSPAGVTSKKHVSSSSPSSGTPLSWEELTEGGKANGSPCSGIANTPSPTQQLLRSPLSPHSPNVLSTPVIVASEDASPACSNNFRAGCTPGVSSSRSMGLLPDDDEEEEVVKKKEGSPKSVNKADNVINNVTFDDLNDIETLGDHEENDATPVAVPRVSSTLQAEDSFLTESGLELDEEEEEEEEEDEGEDDATMKAREEDALRNAVSAALTTTTTTPNAAVLKRAASTTPANTPVAQQIAVISAPTPNTASSSTSARRQQRNAVTPSSSATSPLEEDVVEEVRSWFASVHSKLDVALCAISPAAGAANQPRVGITPPPRLNTRFAPTPTGAAVPSAAVAKTPGAYHPGGAPVTPAGLRSRESPNTLMAPGGVIAKLLMNGTVATPEGGARGTTHATPASEEITTAGATRDDDFTFDFSFSDRPSINTLSQSMNADEAAATAHVNDDSSNGKASAMAPAALRLTCLLTCALLLSGDAVAIVAATLSVIFGAFGSAIAAIAAIAAGPQPIKCVIHASYFIYPPALASALRAVESYLFGSPASASAAADAAAAAIATTTTDAAVNVSGQGLMILAWIIVLTMIAVSAVLFVSPPEGGFGFSAMDALDAVDAVETSFEASDVDISFDAMEVDEVEVEEEVKEEEKEEIVDRFVVSPDETSSRHPSAAPATPAAVEAAEAQPDVVVEEVEKDQDEEMTAEELIVEEEQEEQEEQEEEEEPSLERPSTHVESMKRLMFGPEGEKTDEIRLPGSPAAQKRVAVSTRVCHPPAARAMGAEVW